MRVRINEKQLVTFQLFYTVFIIQWIMSFKSISAVALVSDGINILLLIFLMQGKSSIPVSNSFWNLIKLIIIFEILVGVLQFADNGIIKGGVLLLWSLRMFFRPFLVMFCIEKTYGLNDVKIIEHWIMPLNFAHIVFSAFQFYILNIKYDTNGGIFGFRQGCNGFVNLFYCICWMYIIIQYFNKKSKLINVITILVSALFSGYWSELKFLYIELIIIVLCALLICRFNIRNLLLVSVLALLLIWGYPRLATIMPSNFHQLFDISTLMEYSNTAYNESGLGYISRGEGIQIINQEVFANNPIRQLLGTGLGGANKVSFLNISSLTNSLHGWRHYDYFSIMYIYIEMGYIGLGLFILIGLFLLRCYLKINDVMYRNLGVLMIIVTILNFWYNSSWITEGTAYIMILFLTIPLLKLKREKIHKVELLYGAKYD